MAKSKRKSHATPWPEDFQRIFPNPDSFERFEAACLQIDERRGVKLTEISSILTRAWGHADMVRRYHGALSRLVLASASLQQRSTRIRELLKELLEELTYFFHQQDIDTILRLRVAQLWVQENAREDAPEPPDLQVLDFPPDRLTSSLEPVVVSYHETASFIVTFLDELEALLRRKQGHQEQPWIAPAMRDLRQAGLTRGEADNLLRLAGLGSAD